MLRVSANSLVVFIAVLLFPLGLLAADEAAAIASVKEMGGERKRDKTRPGRPVVELDFYKMFGSKVTDAGLDHLAAFPQLRVLDIGNSRVSDAGLKKLAVLKDLEDLGLAGTDMTDAGIRELAFLKSLRKLDVRHTEVTDEAPSVLATNNPELRSLYAQGTRLTDSGMKHVAALEKLRFLYLYGLDVTDDGVAHLTSLKRLETLFLSSTKVTDAGVERLSALKGLRLLYLVVFESASAGPSDFLMGSPLTVTDSAFSVRGSAAIGLSTFAVARLRWWQWRGVLCP